MRVVMRLIAVEVGIFLPLGLPAQKQSADQWPAYQYNSDFSPLTQITPENVSKLTEAWTFHYGAGSKPSGSLGLDYRFEVQPLIVGGVMYISTPGFPNDPDLKSTISAIEPETGKVLWQFRSPLNIHGRGIAYWPGTKTVGPRLVFATDKGYLMSLDLKTHELAQSFGVKGAVDAYIGVASEKVGESRRNTFTIPNPVSIYKNLIITAARPGEGSPPQPRGDIRAWDATTGKLVWDFHVIPQPGEANHDDWTGDTWMDRSGANTWSTMVVDQERGILYAPTGDSNHADTAPGKNLYANCLLALDAATGKLKWFHQLVHHDVWDFDLPTPPLLIDVHQDGRVIPAVFQTGKMSYAYIFDRVTGEPLYGMEERPVKRSDDPNDQSWPTQPFPLKPGPIARVGMSKEDINKMTPEIEKFCTDFWDSNHLQASGPYARPLSNAAQVTFPSALGGPNWGPLSWNPHLGLVFINVHNTGGYRAARPLAPGGEVATAEPGGGGRQGGGRQGGGRGGAPGGGRGGGGFRGGNAFSYKLPDGGSVPCYAPPYGALVAVDVNKGEIAWTSTLGINESLASMGDLGLKTGTRNLGGSIATASGLVFIAATNDHRIRAFDAKTGKELWVAELPASGHATPMTYLGKDGAQYVVIAASGGTAIGGGLPISDSLVAYRLPK
jgi:quinoprotein glucose dehydrogenase